jgi:hypothetical protein
MVICVFLFSGTGGRSSVKVGSHWQTQFFVSPNPSVLEHRLLGYDHSSSSIPAVGVASFETLFYRTSRSVTEWRARVKWYLNCKGGRIVACV